MGEVDVIASLMDIHLTLSLWNVLLLVNLSDSGFLEYPRSVVACFLFVL